MKIYKVSYNKKIYYVKQESDQDFLVYKKEKFFNFIPTNIIIPIKDCQILAPVNPSKIIGIGTNYIEDNFIKKESFPSIFVSPGSSVIGTKSNINLTSYFKSALIEAELGVLINRPAKNIQINEAFQFIGGYTICNDISARDSTLPSVSNLIKKGTDSFFPIGPCILMDSSPKDFDIKTFINDKLVQSGNTKDMIFSISECIAFISKFVTLNEGDIISMGTPLPKPKSFPGDSIKIIIDQIGVLENNIVSF